MKKLFILLFVVATTQLSAASLFSASWYQIFAMGSKYPSYSMGYSGRYNVNYSSSYLKPNCVISYGQRWCY